MNKQLSASEKTSIWLANVSRVLGEFITSMLVIILVMISFLIGISVHLAEVFDSWFLAIGFQSVVLITSVHSDILPTYKTEKGFDVSILSFVLSVFMCWFIFVAFDGLDFYEKSQWINFTLAITKAVAMSAVELMFSIIFVAKWQLDKVSQTKQSKINLDL